MKLRLTLQWGEVFGPRAADTDRRDELIAAFDGVNCRVAGIKIFADGAIGSATAAIYGRYTGETSTGPTLSTRMRQATSHQAEVSGSLMYSPEHLTHMVKTAHHAGHQVAVHSIGDYSTDLVMDAFEVTGDPKRHRIEHAMILSDAQIDRLAGLGCFCTMQPEFLLRFGHSYRRQLGLERAAKLKRTRSVLDAGIPLSFSSDRPIVAGDPRDGIRTAVHRPEGFDPAEGVTLAEALRAYTIDAAKANGDADLMGELKPGQLADFQIWDASPDNVLGLVAAESVH